MLTMQTMRMIGVMRTRLRTVKALKSTGLVLQLCQSPSQYDSNTWEFVVSCGLINLTSSLMILY